MRRTAKSVFGASVVFVVLLLLCSSVPAQTPQYQPIQSSSSEDDGSHAVIVWVGTIATNLFYIPAKAVYATCGGIIGGIGWMLTGADTDAANGIWGPTVRGNWYVTPSMLEGKEEVRFVGP